MTHRLLPDDGEVAGLLALMLLIDARRPARTTSTESSFRSRSRIARSGIGAQIEEGTAILDAAMGRPPVGEYRIQAAIAAVHDRAARAEDTDWTQILALYELLERLTDNPVVTVNRAVASAMAEGPSAGLVVLDSVDERLAGHYRVDAVRAHLLEMSGDTDAAFEHYRAAAESHDEPSGAALSLDEGRAAQAGRDRAARRRMTTRHARPSANIESPARIALTGSVATRVTQPTSPIAFSARGQRRHSPRCVQADALAIA